MSTPRNRGHNRRQIQMSDEEVDAFLQQRNQTMVLSSHHPDGSIHSVAMWYGFDNHLIGFLTMTKSQKVINLRRDNRMTCLVECGTAYAELRGVELVGTAAVVAETRTLRSLALSLFDRYQEAGEVTEERLTASTRNRV